MLITLDENIVTKDTINILDLRDSPWVDGPGRTILDCAESLESDEFHFIIGSFSGGIQKTSDYAQEAVRRNLTVELIEEKSSFDRNVVRQIKLLVHKHDVDIIHTHDFRSNLFGLYCGWRCKVPVITTAHGWIANNLKGKLYRFADKILLRFFKHIISVSEKTKKLIRRAWVSNKKITVINNALKIEDYIINKNKKIFCDEHRLNSEQILIANIGRLSPEKGQLSFLQAGKKLLDEGYNIVLLLIGIGPDKEMLETYAAENMISDSVLFLGYRSDMLDIYNSIDLVVQSSITEGMPNVMLESLLMQVPVIATDAGGTSQIVIHNETGVLIPVGDMTLLTDSIELFLEEPNKYKEMACNGRKHIQANFSHAKRAKKLSQIYKHVLRVH